MPMSVTTTTGGTAYASPVIGQVTATFEGKLDISTMTTAEVDADGNLKPGLPLAVAGGLLTLVGVAPAFVRGVVHAPIKVAAGNTALASDTSDPLIAIATFVEINRDIAEDNLGRALSANELAGFDAAGSTCALTTT